jgi:hypothetical protein
MCSEHKMLACLSDLYVVILSSQPRARLCEWPREDHFLPIAAPNWRQCCVSGISAGHSCQPYANQYTPVYRHPVCLHGVNIIKESFLEVSSIQYGFEVLTGGLDLFWNTGNARPSS